MYKSGLYITKRTRKTINYKNGYRFMWVVVILLFLLFGLFIYSNFNYIVFKYLISQNYIYTETLDEIYTNTIGEVPENSYLKNFDDVVISIVSAKIREASGDRYTYLYTPTQFENEKTYTKEKAAQSEVKELSEDTVYLKLTNISKYTRKLVNENKELLNAYKNIIIDLKGNGGGDVNELYKISNLFLNKNDILAEEIARHSFFSKIAKSKNEKYFNFENIYILQDKNTASAAEGLIMSLKENLNNVTIVGEQSFGKGIGQITIPIKYGFAVKATVIKVMTPQNNSIHIEGITPDIVYAEKDILEYVQDLIMND